MSCDAARPTFRLLDRWVGWADDGSAPRPENYQSVTGWDENDPVNGIRLVPRGGKPGTAMVDAGELLASLPPRWLALACAPDGWLLLAPDGWVLRLEGCGPRWRTVVDLGIDREDRPAEGALALASSATRFAVVLPDGVQLWTIAGEKLLADRAIDAPRRAAFLADGDWLVAAEPATGKEGIVLHRFGPTGAPRGSMSVHAAGAGTGTGSGSASTRPPVVLLGPVNRLAADQDGGIWIVTGASDDALQLWRGDWLGVFASAATADLAKAFAPTGLTAAREDQGFCLAVTAAGSGPISVSVPECWSWCGEPRAGGIAPPAKPALETSGWVEAVGIDSGIKRCRWHRVRVDADVPPGSGLEVQVVTYEAAPGSTSKAVVPQIAKRNHEDVQTAPAGALDFLIDQPPGRYLSVRLNLTGDGTATPLVRRVRLDFPRSTSLDRLPAVYREHPDAEDFTERFLGNFDASVADLDRAIERFPALLSVGKRPAGQSPSPAGPEAPGAPGAVLPWLGSFLDVLFDADWDDDKRRAILAALPGLLPKRGTPTGLSAVIALVLGVVPDIQEWSTLRAWGALADSRQPCPDEASSQPVARLGSVRLFGRVRARFYLGRSALGQAPIRGYGNPDLDPLTTQAYRFQLQVPRTASLDPARLLDLVDRQKPAHTAVTVRLGGNAFVVGIWSAVGVDTAFTPLSPPVLGRDGNIRLRQASPVASGPPRGRLGLVVGRSSTVGVHTQME
jgi:hypothetical protein